MKERLILSFTFLLAISTVAFAQEDAYKGENLYQLKCGRCHFAYAPEKYSPEEWKIIVNEMGPLSGLNEDSEKIILGYLTEKAAMKERAALPTSPVLAGYVYTEFFSYENKVDTFDVHYLNVNIAGRLHQRVSYKAEFEFEHGGGEAEPPFIEQAYVDVWLLRNMGVRIGAILTPFNRFDEFHGPLENFLVSRPQMSREIGVSAWKEVGVNLHGNLFLHNDFYLNYDAYVINGLGSGSRLRNSRQYRDNNDAKSFGFRLGGVIADRVEAGVSYYRGAWDDDGDFDLTMYGFHLMGKIGEFSLFAEYSNASSKNPAPIEKGKADGFFIQASYLIDGKFRPTIRYGTLDYLDQGSLLGRALTDYDTRVIAIGLNYYLTRVIVFKVEYDFVQEGPRKTDISNNVFSLQAAFRF
ncbi:MAG: porin [Candidatus Aminicenantes bacterium]|nr:porin [Candidatus Aminicenantes bacterium]